MGLEESKAIYGDKLDQTSSFILPQEVWDLNPNPNNFRNQSLVFDFFPAGKFYDPLVNRETIFMKYNYYSEVRINLFQQISPLSKDDVVQLLMYVYEQIDGKDSLLEYLIQDDSKGFIEYIRPLENVFTQCYIYSSIYSNIVHEYRRFLEPHILESKSSAKLSLQYILSFVDQITNAKNDSNSIQYIKTISDMINNYSSYPFQIPTTANEFMQKGEGTNELITSDFIPVHGISSNSQFLFLLVPPNTLKFFPLLPSGGLMSPFQKRIARNKNSDDDSGEFSSKASLVVTDLYIYIYDGGNKYSYMIPQFLSTEENKSKNKPHLFNTETMDDDMKGHIASIGDGSAIAHICRSNKSHYAIIENTTAQRHSNPKYKIDLPNDPLFSNIEDAPITLNGVTMSFHFRTEDGDVLIKTYSLISGKLIGKEQYKSDNIVYSACCDTMNRCQWTVSKSENKKCIQRYFYGGPLNPFIFHIPYEKIIDGKVMWANIQEGKGDEVYESTRKISSFLLNYLGTNYCPKPLIADKEDDMDKLLKQIREIYKSFSKGIIPEEIFFRVLFILVQLLDFGLRFGNINSNEMREKILKCIQKVLIKYPHAYFLYFNNIDFLLKGEEGIQTMIALILASMPNPLINFSWKCLEKSYGFAMLSLHNPSSFSALFPTGPLPMDSYPPKIASLIFLHQRVLLSYTLDYLKKEEHVQPKHELVEENATPFDRFLDYLTIIVDQTNNCINLAQTASVIDNSLLSKMFDNFMHITAAVAKFHAVAQVAVPLLTPILIRTCQFLKHATAIGNTHLSRLIFFFIFTCGKLCATLIQEASLTKLEMQLPFIISTNTDIKENLEYFSDTDFSDLSDQSIIHFLETKDSMQPLYKAIKPFLHKVVKTDDQKFTEKLIMVAFGKWCSFLEQILDFKPKPPHSSILKKAVDKLINIRNKIKNNPDQMKNCQEKALMLIRMKLNLQISDYENVLNSLTDLFSNPSITVKDIYEILKLQNTRNYLAFIAFDLLKTLIQTDENNLPLAKILSYTIGSITKFDQLNTLFLISKPSQDIIDNLRDFFNIVPKIAEIAKSTQIYIFAFRFFRDVTSLHSLKESFLNTILDIYFNPEKKKQREPVPLFALALSLCKDLESLPPQLAYPNFNEPYSWLLLSEALKYTPSNTTLLSTIKNAIQNYPETAVILSRAFIRALRMPFFDKTENKELLLKTVKNDINALISDIGRLYIEHKNLDSCSIRIWMMRQLIYEQGELGELVENIITDPSIIQDHSTAVGCFAILGNSIEHIRPYCNIICNENDSLRMEYIAVPNIDRYTAYPLPFSFHEQPHTIKNMDQNSLYAVPSLTLKPSEYQNKERVFNFILDNFDACTKDNYGWALSSVYMQTLALFLKDEEFAKGFKERQYINKLTYLMPFSDIPSTYCQEFAPKGIRKHQRLFDIIRNDGAQYYTYLSPEIQTEKEFIVHVDLHDSKLDCFIGIVSSNIDPYKTQYTLYDVFKGILYPQRNNIGEVAIVFQGKFDVAVNPKDHTFTINDDLTLPFPYGDVFKFVACAPPKSKITFDAETIDNMEEVFTKTPMPSIDSIGLTFSTNSSELFNLDVHSSSVGKDLLANYEKYPKIAPIFKKENNDVADQLFYYYQPPPFNIVLHIAYAEQCSKNLYNEFQRAKQQKLFYQFSTICAGQYAMLYPDDIPNDILTKLITILSISIESFNPESKKTFMNIPEPFWSNNSKRNLLFNSLENEMIEALKKLIERENTSNTIYKIVQNLSKSKDLHLYHFPSAYHRWIRRQSTNGIAKLNSKNVIVCNSYFNSSTFESCKMNDILNLSLPYVFINDDILLSFKDSNNMDLSFYSIDDQTNLWAFDTIFEVFELIKVLYHTKNSNKYYSWIRQFLMNLFIVQSPLIMPFLPNLISSFSQLLVIPPTQLVKDIPYQKTLKLFGGMLKQYNGPDKNVYQAFYFRETALLSSKTCALIIPSFPQLFGDTVSKPVSLIKNLPVTILDVGAMTKDYKERLELIQRIDQQASSIDRFPFWDAFGLWLRAAGKWPYKYDKIPVFKEFKNHKCHLFNPHRIKYKYQFKFTEGTLNDSSILNVSKTESMVDSDIIPRNQIQNTFETTEEHLYFTIIEVSTYFQNAIINITHLWTKEYGDSATANIETAPFMQQFCDEIREFATVWTKQDTEDLKALVPQYVLDSLTSKPIFNFAKQPFKQFSTNVVIMRLLLLQSYNYIVTNKSNEVPEELWRSMPHYISYDIAAKEILSKFLIAPENTSYVTMEVDRLKAQKREQDGLGSPEDSLISQLGREFKSKFTKDQLRIQKEKIWKVKFTGEQAIDAGGPMKEVMTQGVSSFFHPTTFLTVPTPNGRNKHGANSEFFIPFTTEAKREQDYWAMGILLGVICRSGYNQDVPFAPLVWKYIAHENITEYDLSSIDDEFHTTIRNLREARKNKASFAEQQTFWTTTDWLGKVVTLPGKSSTQLVEIVQVEQYIKECIAYKIRLIKPFLDIIRNAFEENTGVTNHIWYSGPCISRMAQGTSTITVEEMKSLTHIFDYSGFDDPAIKIYWKAVERMANENPHNLVLLLMFQTTLTRLPNKNVQPDFILKIDKLSVEGRDPNIKLPTASTCFNRLHLPPYTSEEACYQKLLTAITFCQTMDNT